MLNRSYRLLLSLALLTVTPILHAETPSEYCQRRWDEQADFNVTAVSNLVDACMRNAAFARHQNNLKYLEDYFFKYLFANENGEFIYYQDGQRVTHFSSKAFSNSNGQFYYLRREKDDDNKTFFSTHDFTNDNGVFRYLRKGNDDQSTFLSTKSFTSDLGNFVYWRRGYDNDANVFFSTKQFSNENGSFLYLRTSANSDDTTFLSIKEFSNSNGHFIYFRDQKDDDNLTFASIANDGFRDAGRNRITRGAFLALIRDRFLAKLGANGFDVVSNLVESNVPALPETP